MNIIMFWLFGTFGLIVSLQIWMSRFLERGLWHLNPKFWSNWEFYFFLKLLGWKISSSFQKGTDILTSLLVLVCSCLSIKLHVTIKSPILEDNNWWLLFQGFRFISFKQTTYFTSFLLTHQYSKTVYR